MEVHHHTHPSDTDSHRGSKRWTHYFWEFFMLFLAVFCGFLAENQREHYVEQQREKQLIRLLVEDLETDTAELKKAISRCDLVANYSDSALVFLSAYKISGQVSRRFAEMIGKAGQRMTLINTDRTSSQLKNAGGMRLIRKKNVSDAILFYWKQIDETNISLDRYLTYRDAGRAIAFKLWVMPEVYRQGLSLPADSIHTLRVIDTDNKKWDELSNLIAINSQIVRQSHLVNLKKQLEMAQDLAKLIKKEYHLK